MPSRSLSPSRSNPLIVALDFDRPEPALALARKLRGYVGMFKVGSQLFTAGGLDVVRRLARLGVGIFLDLKFHDIPNTVAASVAAVADLSGVRLVNVHALGGIEMMRAAAKALGRRRSLKLLAVTILTSHNAASLRCIGVLGRPETRALKLAGLARQAGLDGVVASAHEVAAIKRACGRKFLVVVPGVRPSFAREKKDQARVATPAAALRAGADYIVVGRPITTARHPLVATRALLAEIKNAN